MVTLAEIADLARAAGALLPALSLQWRNEPADDPTQKKIYDLTSEKYSELRQAVNDDNMRVLVHLETCTNCNPNNMFFEVHKHFPSLSDSQRSFVIGEFS